MPEETAATVTVIAPANLNAGQTFEAEVDGKTFTVTVPDGGVEKGGKFEVDYPSKSAVSDAPTGSWRKGLCECFSACCCPFWMAWCLPGIVMAQGTYIRITEQNNEPTNRRRSISLLFRSFTFKSISTGILIRI